MIEITSYRRQIEAALEHAGGTHTFEDVVALVADGKLQFWPGPHSAIITELVDHPRLREVRFFLAGGRADELERMEPVVLAWAKTQGCTRATMLGRRGWQRSFLVRHGWKLPKLAVLEKSLTDGEK